jgi:transposase
MGVADVKEILVQWDGGEDITRIAETLGYSRPTVRKYVRAAEAGGLVRGSRREDEAGWERLARATLARFSEPRPPGAARLAVAGFHDYLAERVGRVKVSVLYQRLHDDRGMAASWGTFYRYVRAHWPERLAPAPAPTIRLDDPPAGEEAQVDFFYAGRWQDRAARRERRLYGFLMTLSHSRHEFLYPVLAEDETAWLEGHVEAFHFFGGAPRRLVPDNLTAGILKPDRYDPRANRAYGELSRYYGCLVDPSRVRHPKDKPRVERNVAYARESFFRDRDFESLAEWREAAVRWALDVAGQRVHGTTGERPLVAFRAREQAALSPLPPKRWERVAWTTAKLQHDCHLRVGGAGYSAPHAYIGQPLDVRSGARVVEIYAGGELLTTHLRIAGGRSTRDEHYPEGGRSFLRATPQACLAQARSLGAATATIIRTLLEPRTLHQLREAQAILRLAEAHDATRLERACARALAAGDGRYRTVRRILERGLDQLALEETPPPSSAGAFLRGPAALAAGGAEEA